MAYQFGTAQGNYVRLEILLPQLNLEPVTEDYIIQFLLEDNQSRAAIIVHFEHYPIPGRRCMWLHHKRLTIPLLYEMGEGDESFVERLRCRQMAGLQLGIVRWFCRGAVPGNTH